MFHTHGHETFADRYMSAQTGPLSQWLQNRAMHVVSAVFALQILSYWQRSLSPATLQLSRSSDLISPRWFAMALETLRYGSFRPTWVQSDSKALPGYGGEVTGWADYKFSVLAVERKEATLSEGEKKKLGPLGLRLIERLAGPALQVAKKLGLDELEKPEGVKSLLTALETHLMPLRKQAALELYHAGMKEGVLSRQHGEPMASYCLRREAWWSQLRELDPAIQCSDGILGEQLLLGAGLGHLEQQMVRTGCQNDLSDMNRLANTLRDQFGAIHDREGRGKGKGKSDRDGRGWYQRTGYYTSEIVDAQQYAESYDQENVEHYNDEELYVGEGDEGYYYEEDEKEKEIEEEVVAWYASQSIDAQTCSHEDLEMVIEAVEVEMAAYYTKVHAEQRGITSPASSSNYGGTTLSSPERQAKVLAAKQRSRCRSCGQMGHWQRDPICPNNRRKGKGKGYGGKKGGKGKPGKKGDTKDGGKGGSNKGHDKPRVVYFSIQDTVDVTNEESYMALEDAGDPGGAQEPLDSVQQREMEAEVARLMRLPQQEIDRLLAQELAFMPTTSKATMPVRPASVLPGPSSVPPAATSTTIQVPLPKAVMPPMQGCEHKKRMRRGTNAYISMVSCSDCGKVLVKEPKEHTRTDGQMATMSAGECLHPPDAISWRGSNGYVWKWTCNTCGATDTKKKTPGATKPDPYRGPHGDDQGRAPNDATSSTAMVGPHLRAPISSSDGGFLDEELFGSVEEWYQFSQLLHRMVVNHLGLHGTITSGEFHHITSATTLCYKTFGQAFTQTMTSGPQGWRHQSPGARSGASGSARSIATMRTEEGGIAGNNKINFGRYKGYTFEDVYEMDESYVQFCLDEKAKGEAYCANMKRFQDYCEGRRNRAGPVAYMVSDEASMEEGTDEDDGFLMYLDSGCNSTCHGQKWMERYERLTGYKPEWLSKIAKNMTGIGGSTRSLGTRRLYVGLETQEGYHVPGELVSTEIEGSMAPMLLSLQAQESLGMIVDLANGIVTSQTLGCTFRAVRGKKNRLIGLRLQPGDYLDDDATIPVSLMADQEDEEDQRRPKTKMTYQVKEIPRRRGYYDRDSASSTDAPTGAGRGGSTPPWRRNDPAPPWKKGRMQSSGPSSSSAQEPLQEEWIEEETENEEYVLVAHEEQEAEGAAEEEEEIEVDVEIEPEDQEEEPQEDEHEETRSEAERRRFVSERERRGYLDREADPWTEDLERRTSGS